MQIKINSYVTAVDENDVGKGNHQVYSVTFEDNGGAKNYPNLSSFNVISLIVGQLQLEEDIENKLSQKEKGE